MADSMVGPHLPIVTVDGDERPGVVRDGHAERWRAAFATSSVTRRRAASSSGFTEGAVLFFPFGDGTQTVTDE
jgi:hypothetical protein